MQYILQQIVHQLCVTNARDVLWSTSKTKIMSSSIRIFQCKHNCMHLHEQELFMKMRTYMQLRKHQIFSAKQTLPCSFLRMFRCPIFLAYENFTSSTSTKVCITTGIQDEPYEEDILYM